MVRAMLYHAHGCLHLWGEALHTATHILNRSLSRGHPSKSPHQLYTNIKPSMKHSHVWGCDVYYIVPESKRAGKLDEKARKGIFMGYDDNNDSYYRIYDVDKDIITMSRDVKFHEHTFNEMKVLSRNMEREVIRGSDGDPVSGDDDYVKRYGAVPYTHRHNCRRE